MRAIEELPQVAVFGCGFRCWKCRKVSLRGYQKVALIERCVDVPGECKVLAWIVDEDMGNSDVVTAKLSFLNRVSGDKFVRGDRSVLPKRIVTGLEAGEVFPHLH